MKKHLWISSLLVMAIALLLSLAGKPEKVKAARFIEIHFSIEYKLPNNGYEYAGGFSIKGFEVSDDGFASISIDEIITLAKLEHIGDYTYSKIDYVTQSIGYSVSDGTLNLTGISSDVNSCTVGLLIEVDTVSFNFTTATGYPENSNDIYTGTVYKARRATMKINEWDILSCLTCGSGSSAKKLDRRKVVITHFDHNTVETADYVLTVDNNNNINSYSYSLEIKDAITSLEYDGATDSIVLRSPVKGVWCQVTDCKKATGLKFNWEKVKVDPCTCIETTDYDYRYGNGYFGVLPLYTTEKVDKDEYQIKIAPGKVAYLYIGTDFPDEDDKGNVLVEPNFIIEPTEYKKAEVVLNYAGASAGENYGWLPGISAINITKSDGSVASYSYNAADKQKLKEYNNFLYNVQVFEKTTYKKDVDMGEMGHASIGGYAYVLAEKPEQLSVDTHENFYSLIKEDRGYGFKEIFYYQIGGDMVFKFSGDSYADWHYQYGSRWGNERLYRYEAYLGESVDTDKSISTQRTHYYYYIEDYGYASGYNIRLRDNEGKDIYRCILKFDPSTESPYVLLSDTVFEYHEADGAEGYPLSGFYIQKTINKENRNIRLEEFGIQLYNDAGKFWVNGDKIYIKVTQTDLIEDFGLIPINKNNLSVQELGLVENESKIVMACKDAYNFNTDCISWMLEELHELSQSKSKEKKSLVFRLTTPYDGKNYYRCSKDFEIKMKAPAKAVKIKFDIKTEKIAIKNGFDYMIDDGTEEWYTILPYNASGTAKSPIIKTGDYTPVKKPADNLEMYTAQKITGISVEDVIDVSGGAITVRKSATYAKSASAGSFEEETCWLWIDSRTGAPTLTLKDGNYGVSDDKDNIVLPSISKNADDWTSISSFEYIIIDKADYEAELKTPGTLDKTLFKWSKYAAGKKITVGKTKSKYKSPDAEKADNHVLEDGSYILIRRSGDKNKAHPTEPILASTCAVIKLTTTTVDGNTKYVLSAVE